MTNLQDLFSQDLSILYRIIYTSANDIDSNLPAAFLAFNSLHMHGEAVSVLKQLVQERSKVVGMCLADSPLYSLLIPIAAEEYGVDLLNISEFSTMFKTCVDFLINIDCENIKVL